MMCRLLEKVRETTGYSNYRIHKELGVSEALVSSWHRDKSQPNGENTLKLMILGNIEAKNALLLMTEKAPTQGQLSLADTLDCILC